MAEELLETEAIEEPVAAGDPVEGSARLLPELASRAGELSVWRDEVKAAALAAGAGVIAGAAAVVVARAGRSATRRRGTGIPGLRRREPPQRVVASRSFLIDVHLLGHK